MDGPKVEGPEMTEKSKGGRSEKWFTRYFRDKMTIFVYLCCPYRNISDVIFVRVCTCSGTVCLRLRQMTFFDLVMTFGLSFLLSSLECCFCSTSKWPSLLKLFKDTLPILSDYTRKNANTPTKNLILLSVLLLIFLRIRLSENKFWNIFE